MSKKANKEKKTSNPQKDNYLKKPLIIMGVSLAILIVATVTVCILVFNNVINIPFIDDFFINTGMKEVLYTETPTATGENEKKPENTTDEVIDLGDNYTPPSFDADEYFETNTKLYADYSAKTSSNVMSESEVYDDFTERGFINTPIETEYSIDGDNYELYEISSYSSTTHPIYQTYFQSSKGDLWIIYNIDGAVFATPLTFSLGGNTNIRVMVSETDTIISYDATTNKFYENIPDTAETNILTVHRIDAETLESLTNGGTDQ